MTTATQTGYASVNGLQLSYEIHGAGRPLLLLPGASMTTTGFADDVRREHAVDRFRLRGGGNGDLVGWPDARLAVLPGTTHLGVLHHTHLLLAFIPSFLDPPTDAPSP
jgi:hypothetical protein